MSSLVFCPLDGKCGGWYINIDACTVLHYLWFFFRGLLRSRSFILILTGLKVHSWREQVGEQKLQKEHCGWVSRLAELDMGRATQAGPGLPGSLAWSKILTATGSHWGFEQGCEGSDFNLERSLRLQVIKRVEGCREGSSELWARQEGGVSTLVILFIDWLI